MPRMKSRATRLALGAVVLGGLTALASGGLASAAPLAEGVVYTQTNATSGNSVQVFLRQANGTLIPGGAFATGGTGTGGTGLSQGSVELSADGHILVAVNAGSSQISDFTVTRDGGLRLINTISSGGTEPISVAIDGSLVEVLNIGGTANVAGFAATSFGLIPIAGASQPLSSGASGAEDVTISPDGSHAFVTEKTSNTIDTFAIGSGGTLAPVVTSPSDGPGAFASVFTHDGRLLVADAGGSGASALSPYQVDVDGTVAATGPALPNAQSAACWITLGKGGNVFVANAGSSSISTYRVLHNGSVGFFGNFNAGAGAKPLDLATAPNGRFLYELDGVNHVISAFAVGPVGQLTAISQQPIPASAVGLAAG